MTSSPRFVQSNREVERAVQVAENLTEKGSTERQTSVHTNVIHLEIMCMVVQRTERSRSSRSNAFVNIYVLPYKISKNSHVKNSHVIMERVIACDHM